jgi:stage II sporulation protein AA (anti-sigma F factor antagonist)
MVEELQIETRTEQGVAILELKGLLNVSTYGKLEKALKALFNEGRYRVIVDMGKVEYVSSAGAGALMNALSQCNSHQGRLVLVNLSPSVLEVLDVLSLNRVFPTMPSLESALAAFRTT